MTHYKFFREYQENSVYNKILSKYFIYSVIPVILMIMISYLTFFHYINFLFYILYFICSILIYFFVGVKLIVRRRGEYRAKEDKIIKQLLIKYNYYSETKINYLIELCNIEIQKKEQRKHFFKSYIMFILPLLISVIALFHISENKTIIIILETIILIISIVCFIIMTGLFFKEYISILTNKKEINYESLRNELYNVLLNNDFKQNIFSKIKELLF